MGAEERFNCNAGLRVFVFFLVVLFFLSLGLCFFLKWDFRGDPSQFVARNLHMARTLVPACPSPGRRPLHRG